MKTRDSMNDYIERMVKRYSYLFTLPSHARIIMLLFAFSLLNGTLIILALKPASDLYNILTLILALGASLFILIMVVDFTVHFLFKGDLIFNLRRCSALSLYSVILWSGFVVLGFIAEVFFNGGWFRPFVLGFAVVLAFRLLVLYAVSFAGAVKVLFYSVLSPALFSVPVFHLAYALKGNFFDTSAVLFFSSFLIVALGTFLIFSYAINHVGVSILGVGSFSVLKAFLVSWTEDLNEPFERFFERFGQKSDIKVSALAFKTSEKVKTLLVVPAFHPGPFKNVGSSGLPYSIQVSLETKLPNSVVAVPHGLSGHDLDLASQTQNQLVLEAIQKMTDFSSFGPVATRFVRIRKNGASVGCQIFNNCALMALTLAPETMEDLPPELDSFIVDEARRLNLSTAISVDAHNSIQGPFNIDEAINPLKQAATSCLKKASQQKPSSFEVGVTKITPNEFDLNDGMGPGGIIVTIVKVSDQRIAYVTIDGNNMISGLRERILSALSEVGVEDGEVFTTDTHAVNAVVLNARGYHPVGEAMDQETLITHIKKAAVDALANMEPAEASWRMETVSGVKVIGEKQIEAMCMLADKAVQTAKRMVFSLFPLAGVVLAVLLLL